MKFRPPGSRTQHCGQTKWRPCKTLARSGVICERSNARGGPDGVPCSTRQAVCTEMTCHAVSLGSSSPFQELHASSKTALPGVSVIEERVSSAVERRKYHVDQELLSL